MKKLITIIIVVGLTLTMQAQDITNTLGTDGNFFVNKTGGTPSYLTLSSTADHTMQFSTSTTGLTFNNSIGESVFAFSESHDIAATTMLIVGHADANWLGGNFAHLQLQSENNIVNNKFAMVARNAVNYFGAYSANGTGASPTNSVDNQGIFQINAYGYQNSGNRLAAAINFTVDGTPASNFVPGKIHFSTSTSSAGSTIRMTIKNDGTVNISGLTGTGTEFVKVDASGNLVRSASKGPSLAPINNEIQLLKEENETLKAEMAELRKMVELLMEE